MLVAYFDEVKYQAGKQPYFWLCALVANAETIYSLENALAEMSKECFGSSVLSSETEFHAADIFHRKRNFKEWTDISARIEIIKRLARLLDDSDVGKIEIRVEPERMVKSDYEEMAFIFLVERVEGYLRSRKAPGLLIGDRDSEKTTSKFAEMLSRCRSSGTPYHFGINLQNLIDTVHFTHSHHSRMLQLADLYVWVSQLCKVGNREHYPQSELIKYIGNETNLLSPNKYKNWPTSDSWIKTS